MHAMAYALNETHNPDAQSWIASANAEQCDFPLQNLPFGVFVPADAGDDAADATPRVGVAIGDFVLDVLACHERGAFHGRAEAAAEACDAPTLNELMALGWPAWSALRAQLYELLRANHTD